MTIKWSSQKAPLALPWPAWHTDYGTHGLWSSDRAEYERRNAARYEFVNGLGDEELLRRLELQRQFISAQFKFAAPPASIYWNALTLERDFEAQVVKRFAERVQREARDLREAQEAVIESTVEAMYL